MDIKNGYSFVFIVVFFSFSNDQLIDSIYEFKIDFDISFILFEDALMGIKDLVLKHPAELKLHRYAVIDKLRERISDDDKVVREALYQLFKCEILPGCAEVIFLPHFACY